MDSHVKDMKYEPVSEFYKGKSVFITGGTGFLGKVLIEKLLYNCPEIENIYILMRNMNGTSADKRLEQMLSSPFLFNPLVQVYSINKIKYDSLKMLSAKEFGKICLEIFYKSDLSFSATTDQITIKLFSRIHNEKPQTIEKVQYISGDLTVPNMGLTEEQMSLVKKVSVVFHLAATIKFNEPLKKAMLVNVEGTREVIRLFKQFNNLQSFVYISTAFSNSNEEVIEEIIYPPPRKFDDVYKYIENEADEKNIQEFLNGRPNTYTFTKALAENVVAQECDEMPVAIIRPSIVTPALKEPVRGWIDNWFGITYFLYAIAKGWIRLLYGKKHNVIDLIPVDYVVNLIIIAASRCKRSKSMPVYNICSSSSNPIHFSMLEKLYVKESAARGFNDFPLFGIIYITSPTVIRLLSVIFEILPAYLADFWIKLSGKGKSSLSYVKMQEKQSMIRESVKFFASHSWIIKSTGARELFTSLSAQDQLLFPCDPVNFNWSDYIPTYFQGMKMFLLDSKLK